MIETYWDILDDNGDFPMMGKDIHPIVQKILIHKGITDVEAMKEFLSPKPQRTYDPFLMKNMREVVDVIVAHIQQGKSIWIYGDYDVDGVASIAVLMDFLKRFTSNLHYYIPLRAEEGYGLNCEAIEDIKKQGADLIITVDCGSTSVKEVQLARDLGMEIIVTDHHNLSDTVPNCLILNPKQGDCNYPFKLLCGCGIAFKLAQGIQKTLDAPKSYLNDLLDVVALATVADVVPLIDENRTLLKYGLKKMTNCTRPGLKGLIEVLDLAEKDITTTHIGFILGPHFNASGRIDDARAGVELLLETDGKKIEALIRHLVTCNHERKTIQDKGLELCKIRVEKNYLEDLFLVVDSEGTHEGVIGIIAGKIRDFYYKPTLIVTEGHEEGIMKGSGRSIDGMDIYEELKKCSDLFIKFGGHKNACGFSIERDKLETLRRRLNEQAKRIKEESPEVFVKTIKVYAELKPSELTEKLLMELERIEPYGMGNEKPQFLLSHLKVDNAPQGVAMGKNQEHLKLKGISSKWKDKIPVQAIGFGMADFYIKELKCPEEVDVVGFPRINEWNGYKNMQFMISDVKKSNQ
ncbi:single-stranded-DNA-specific exonuclease [Anaerosolibacter carboniphilus]|uniref:Single-stranded-DNA-specific exonuclease RecJ n=1 Tax=Anaerosolibacter carboniphilus TaxID=1417629 RepID=A0A841KYP8_9FIRM|nr:single-stranded-DNA-specific exonuclease RecJ [Anaerosolibacter carboniphilus]MBB6218754.1 single-stranded-DNA-specific exonuclease [Anaerosolibacter carboniphilus]